MTQLLVGEGVGEWRLLPSRVDFVLASNYSTLHSLRTQALAWLLGPKRQSPIACL